MKEEKKTGGPESRGVSERSEPNQITNGKSNKYTGQPGSGGRVQGGGGLGPKKVKMGRDPPTKSRKHPAQSQFLLSEP